MEDLIMFDTDTQPVAERFSVDTLDKANWAMAKIARAEASIAQRTELANRYIGRVQKWLEESNKLDVTLVDSMTELLKPFAEIKIAQSGKAKNVKLLGGEIGFRSGPATLDITDEASAMAWAKEHCPEAVKVTESLLKTPLKDAITKKGEIPVGVELKPGEVRWYVKTDAKAIEG